MYRVNNAEMFQLGKGIFEQLPEFIRRSD